MLPKFLFRGDRDEKKSRRLKETINSGILLTNLCNGGNGKEIFTNTLVELINRHINIGWDKTHFLSFSTDEQVAFSYASHGEQYEELFDYQEDWLFAVLTFDTTLITPDSLQEISTGIYSAYFTPICYEFLPKYKIILIDVISHLQNISNNKNDDLSTTIKKAERDKEWLILPANPFGNNGEYTAKFDSYCISSKRIFRTFQ